MLTLAGWGGYLPYTQGWLPGHHGAASLYSQLLGLPAFILFFAALYGAIPWLLGIGGVGLLGYAGRWRRGRRLARRGAIALLGWGLLMVITFPALAIGYSRPTALTIPPWGDTYRTVFITPAYDDTYGDVMLLRCGKGGWCHQVYRQYVDFNSAEKAQLVYDSARDRLGLNLRGEWVYVRSPTAPPCRQDHPTPMAPCHFPLG
jgi:hypothetical protein